MPLCPAIGSVIILLKARYGEVSVLVSILLYLSGRNEKVCQQNNDSEKSFEKTKGCVWPQIKIMWEEQVVDPPVE